MEQGIRRRINADALKQLRESKVLTQQELAERAHVSRATINAYENGADRPPRPSHVRRVAAALDADPRDLVTISFD